MFAFYKPSRLVIEPTQPLIQWVQEVTSPGRDRDHLPSPTAEINNQWSYTSAPRIRLHFKHSNTHTALIPVNNQPDAQFFLFRIYLFQFPTCFEHTCAHHQENQLY